MGYWDDVTPDSVSNAQGGFQEFKVGPNDAFIKSVEEKHSRNGNEMVVITFENEEGAELRYFIVNDAFKLGKLKALSIAFGIPMGSRNTSEWIGKEGIVECKQGKPYGDSGNVYNEVKYLRPKKPSQPSHNQGNSTAPGPQSQSSQGSYSAGEYPQGDDQFTDDIPF